MKDSVVVKEGKSVILSVDGEVEVKVKNGEAIIIPRTSCFSSEALEDYEASRSQEKIDHEIAKERFEQNKVWGEAALKSNDYSEANKNHIQSHFSVCLTEALAEFEFEKISQNTIDSIRITANAVVQDFHNKRFFQGNNLPLVDVNDLEEERYLIEIRNISSVFNVLGIDRRLKDIEELRELRGPNHVQVDLKDPKTFKPWEWK